MTMFEDTITHERTHGQTPQDGKGHTYACIALQKPSYQLLCASFC